MRHLLHHARRVRALTQHSSSAGKRDVSGTSASLRRADSQKRRLGDHRRIRHISANAAGESSVHTAELFVHYGLDAQIAGQLHLEFAQRLRREQVHGDSGFHVVRAASIKTIAFNRTTEGIARPWLRAAWDGVHVAGKNQRTSTARALSPRTEIGPAGVLSALYI